MSAVRTVALPLVLLGLVACSDDTISATDFVDDYLEAYCGYIMRCCDAVERSYMTSTACQLDRRPYVEQLLASKADGAKVTVLNDKARACIDSLGDSDCSAATTARDCLVAVTRGQQASGDPCSTSPECESYYCIQDQKDVEGYCAAGSGGNCSGDDRACAAGSYCDDGTLQCLPRKEEGQICHRPEQCQSGICSPQKVCVAAPTPLCDGE